MSWDVKALLVLALIWAALAVIYVSLIGMLPGGRAWGAGALILGALMFGVWYAESLGARASRPASVSRRPERSLPTVGAALSGEAASGVSGDS